MKRRKRTTGAVLLVVGGAVMLGGAAMALSQLVSLYGAVLDDPMEVPEGTEQAASRRMLTGAAIGACGVPLAIVGAVKLRARRKREDAS